MRYRRAKVKGGTYFFTVVTHKRVKIFTQSDNVDLLRQAFKKVKERHPFKIVAFVLLPDHLHCIWTLPQGDADFSTRWRLIKSDFSRQIGLVGWVEGRNPTKKTFVLFAPFCGYIIFTMGIRKPEALPLPVFLGVIVGLRNYSTRSLVRN